MVNPWPATRPLLRPPALLATKKKMKMMTCGGGDGWYVIQEKVPFVAVVVGDIAVFD